MIGRILCVDDEPSILVWYRDVLAAALPGVEVRSAPDGLAALALVEDWIPDAIVLDLAMPGMDGLGFLSRRAEVAALRAIPVVVASAGVDEQPALARLEVAARLTKPFPGRALVDAMRRVTDR